MVVHATMSMVDEERERLIEQFAAAPCVPSNITAETLQAAIETRMAEPLAVLADQTRQRGTLILTSDAAK